MRYRACPHRPEIFELTPQGQDLLIAFVDWPKSKNKKIIIIKLIMKRMEYDIRIKSKS